MKILRGSKTFNINEDAIELISNPHGCIIESDGLTLKIPNSGWGSQSLSMLSIGLEFFKDMDSLKSAKTHEKFITSGNDLLILAKDAPVKVVMAYSISGNIKLPMRKAYHPANLISDYHISDRLFRRVFKLFVKCKNKYGLFGLLQKYKNNSKIKEITYTDGVAPKRHLRPLINMWHGILIYMNISNSLSIRDGDSLELTEVDIATIKRAKNGVPDLIMKLWRNNLDLDAASRVFLDSVEIDIEYYYCDRDQYDICIASWDKPLKWLINKLYRQCYDHRSKKLSRLFPLTDSDHFIEQLIFEHKTINRKTKSINDEFDEKLLELLNS